METHELELKTEPSSRAGPPKKVAVVAVHGVGVHARFETARTIADLLLRFNEDCYQPFREVDLRIPVNRAPVRDANAGERSQNRSFAQKFMAAAFHDQRSISMIQFQSGKNAETDADSLGTKLMEDRLRHYQAKGSDQVFESIRCESTYSESGKATCDTHVYEMFWSDISSFGTGVVQLIFRLYSLIFDLCLLGRQTLDAVLALQPKSRPWKVFQWLHSAAETALVQWIVLGNVLMFLMVTFVALPFASDWWLRAAGCAFVPLSISGVLMWIAFKSRTAINPTLWGWSLLLIALIVAAAAVWALDSFQGLGRAGALGLCATELGLALSCGYYLLVREYDRRHLGAAWVGLFLGAALLIFLVVDYPSIQAGDPNDPDAHLIDVVMRSVELLYIPLTIAWGAFWMIAVSVSVAGFIAVRANWVTGSKRVSARRAAWTANLTLLLPGALSLVATASLWGAVVLTVNRALLKHFPLGVHRILWSPADQPGILFGRATDQLIQQGMGVLPRTLLGLAIAGAIAVWSLAPAIWLEVFPPESPTTAGGRQVKWLGKNLTAGFSGLRVAGEALRWIAIASTLSLAALAIHVPQAGIISSHVDPSFPHFFIPLEKDMVKPAILAGGALVLALFSARGMFEFLALGFHTTLQVAIDVVNWMRFHPLNNNPQARICARYYSLLRYVAEWRDPVDGRGYDSLVIVAHSQGTVITADFLRYLTFVDGKATNRLSESGTVFKNQRVHLFTMGSPLRQIYSVRFPHVYGWANGTGDPPFKEPNYADLYGVATWTNAFRSGDYIGRSLWHEEANVATWCLPLKGAALASGHREYCVGEGAHTHYWDETAGSVAHELQNLINA